MVEVQKRFKVISMSQYSPGPPIEYINVGMQTDDPKQIGGSASLVFEINELKRLGIFIGDRLTLVIRVDARSDTKSS
jgi:hypothetical protein